MDAASELSQFLTSRRAKVTPEQAGLPSYGQRRVPGLRREEVASLVGVSVEYYKRLERGNATGDYGRPAVGPCSTHNHAPTGRVIRSSSHGRSCSQPRRSIPTSRRRPPFP